MATPTHRVAIVARQLTAQTTAGESKNSPPRFTVIDNDTGKKYEVTAPDGRFTMDLERIGSGEKSVVYRKAYAPGSRTTIANHRVHYIGAPFAEGQNLRGCELAPMAVRHAGLKVMVERMGWQFVDNGDLALPCGLVPETSGLSAQWQALTARRYMEWIRSGTTESYAKWSGEKIREEDARHVSTDVKESDAYSSVPNAKILGKACGLVHSAVRRASAQGDFPLTIGGDHSIASATIGALIETYPNLCVVWVDAHADANTPETSPSHNYHGMPAAHVMGWFSRPLPGFEWLRSRLPENRLAYIGLRDIDIDEGRMLQESGCHIFTMQDVDRHGISQVMSMAMSKIDPYNNRPIHLTLDVDGIDPAVAPGTGTLARGGLSYRETHYICEDLAATNRLVGCDLVEVNPLVDYLPEEQMHGDDPDLGPASCTVQLCCELALSVLGKTIIQRPKNQVKTLFDTQ